MLQAGHWTQGSSNDLWLKRGVYSISYTLGEVATVSGKLVQKNWLSFLLQLYMKFLLEDSILARGYGNLVANCYSVFKNPKSVSTDIVWNFYLIGSCGIVCYYVYNVNANG